MCKCPTKWLTNYNGFITLGPIGQNQCPANVTILISFWYVPGLDPAVCWRTPSSLLWFRKSWGRWDPRPPIQSPNLPQMLHVWYILLNYQRLPIQWSKCRFKYTIITWSIWVVDQHLLHLMRKNHRGRHRCSSILVMAVLGAGSPGVAIASSHFGNPDLVHVCMNGTTRIIFAETAPMVINTMGTCLNRSESPDFRPWPVLFMVWLLLQGYIVRTVDPY